MAFLITQGRTLTRKNHEQIGSHEGNVRGTLLQYKTGGIKILQTCNNICLLDALYMIRGTTQLN